jgi:hypothetical protein
MLRVDKPVNSDIFFDFFKIFFGIFLNDTVDNDILINGIRELEIRYFYLATGDLRVRRILSRRI